MPFPKTEWPDIRRREVLAVIARARQIHAESMPKDVPRPNFLGGSPQAVRQFIMENWSMFADTGQTLSLTVAPSGQSGEVVARHMGSDQRKVG